MKRAYPSLGISPKRPKPFYAILAAATLLVGSVAPAQELRYYADPIREQRLMLAIERLERQQSHDAAMQQLTADRAWESRLSSETQRQVDASIQRQMMRYYMEK